VHNIFLKNHNVFVRLNVKVANAFTAAPTKRMNDTMSKKKEPETETISKTGNQKMRDLADILTSELPGCGFALIVVDLDSGERVANYISNVNDDFMKQVLENQINALNYNQTFPTAD